MQIGILEQSWTVPDLHGGEASRPARAALRQRAALILSNRGVTIERIADLVGHSTPTTTQTVYRKQIRPMITYGAEAMDTVFSNEDPPK